MQTALRIVALRDSMDALEKQLAEAEQELRDYVQSSGETTIGPLQAVERQNPPRLVGASGKQLEFYKEQLAQQLPDQYWHRRLDVSRMMAGLDTDFNLRALLVSKGLSIVSDRIIYFKKV